VQYEYLFRLRCHADFNDNLYEDDEMIMMMTVMTDDIQLTKDFILMMNYGIQ
jgi:hypothetical protein